MRLLLTVIATALLVAVVEGLVPLAWGFVALTVFVFLCYWSIYDLLTPLPATEEDED